MSFSTNFAKFRRSAWSGWSLIRWRRTAVSKPLLDLLNKIAVTCPLRRCAGAAQIAL